jgi:hypothetical protein
MATRDELEDDILFQNVLIESLDIGADDYGEKLAAFEATKKDLERQMAALNTSGPPAGLDASSDLPQANTPTHPGRNTYTPYLNNPGSAQYTANHVNSNVNPNANTMKRPRPHSSFLEQNEHPSKRPTAHPRQVRHSSLSITRIGRRQTERATGIWRTKLACGEEGQKNKGTPSMPAY